MATDIAEQLRERGSVQPTGAVTPADADVAPVESAPVIRPRLTSAPDEPAEANVTVQPERAALRIERKLNIK